MENRFIRNLGAITEDECGILKNKKVFIAGCGGLGGYIAEYLTRIGVGEIVACDGDCFDETNLNRQLLSCEDNIGKNKALEARRRAKTIVPDISFTSIAEFLTEENAERLISGCDVVMDALDSVKARKILAYACAKEGIPLVHGAIEGWFAQVAVVMPNCTILDRLYPDAEENKNKSSLSFTPALCASIQCAEAVKLLLGREVSLKNKVLFADLLTNEMRTFEL